MLARRFIHVPEHRLAEELLAVARNWRESNRIRHCCKAVLDAHGLLPEKEEKLILAGSRTPAYDPSDDNNHLFDMPQELRAAHALRMRRSRDPS